MTDGEGELHLAINTGCHAVPGLSELPLLPQKELVTQNDKRRGGGWGVGSHRRAGDDILQNAPEV